MNYKTIAAYTIPLVFAIGCSTPNAAERQEEYFRSVKDSAAERTLSEAHSCTDLLLRASKVERDGEELDDAFSLLLQGDLQALIERALR